MKKIRDLLKHYLKGRSKITEALIVTFLITGSVGYSQTVKGDSSQVVISSDDIVLTITESGYVDGSENLDTGLIMDGGSDFDILVPERDKDMVKIGASFEGEQENGFIYNIGGGYITASDIDEYYVGTGIGFNF